MIWSGPDPNRPPNMQAMLAYLVTVHYYAVNWIKYALDRIRKQD